MKIIKILCDSITPKTALLFKAINVNCVLRSFSKSQLKFLQWLLYFSFLKEKKKYQKKEIWSPLKSENRHLNRAKGELSLLLQEILLYICIFSMSMKAIGRRYCNVSGGVFMHTRKETARTLIETHSNYNTGVDGKIFIYTIYKIIT